ncbi:LOW QUALITY PROTEIN: uncharacterized protein LOC135405997 [Pseudopipra pipra]|uniref:LOW QUALITY PROTEIN: uncharacterized protein LOC135405997 n=1 Tax=Pseudopipra pipra TaxID=415032 RepID=UPI0031389CE3
MPVVAQSPPHLVLLVLVVLRNVSGPVSVGFVVWLQLLTLLPVFQGSPGPESDARVEIQARNQTERCIFPSLVRYFCQPQGQSPPAPAGCKFCPQDWQLRGERCYWLSKESGNWTRGRKSCKDQGSELVVLKNETEMVNREEKAWKGPRSPGFLGGQGSKRLPAAGGFGVQSTGRSCPMDLGGQVCAVASHPTELPTERFFWSNWSLPRQEDVESVTGRRPWSVWVGLRSQQKEWTWVDDTPYDPHRWHVRVGYGAINPLSCRFGDLPEVDEGCGTLKGKSLDVDVCASDHKWVCQKAPFQLSPPTAGDVGKLDDAST